MIRPRRSQCRSCLHLVLPPRGRRFGQCRAFDAIPPTIWQNGHGHDRVWPDDRGVRFVQHPTEPSFDVAALPDRGDYWAPEL